jgi:xanthine/uracil permease
MQYYREERSLGELFSDLVQDSRRLVNQEIALAKVEMSEKAAQAARGVAFVAVGGFIVYAGFLALMAAAIIGLSDLLPWWLSALVVGLVVAVIGYFLIQRGRDNLKGENLAPRQTMASLQEDKEFVKEQVSGNGRNYPS